MKSSQFAWILGAVSSLGLGMAAQACSSSSPTGNSSTSTSTSSGSNHTSTTSTGSNSGTTSGTTTATGSNSGTTILDGGAKCYSAPGKVYAEDGSTGLYCPFSETDASGGKAIHCATGQQCCSPPESAMLASTCEPVANACPVKDSVDWVCEGTPDCKTGTLCCGQGTIATQSPQPGCGDGGSTIPAYPYVSGFYGSACQASCAHFGDGGNGFQICSKDSECTTPGESCIPIKPKGNSIGYCGVATGSGSGSSSSSTASTSASSTSASSGSSGSSGSSTSSAGH